MLNLWNGSFYDVKKFKSFSDIITPMEMTDASEIRLRQEQPKSVK